MSHLSVKPIPPAGLLLPLCLAMALSLALWFVPGCGLFDGFTRPASNGPALTNEIGDETPHDFTPQGPCDVAVTNAGDSGPGSLRQAIADVCDGGRITFAADYTIYLNSTLSITKRLAVDGETHAVAVSGDSGGDGTPNVPVFYIGGVVTLTHLNIVNGAAGDDGNGGGIYNNYLGTLAVQDSTLSGNSASEGGGIYNYGWNTLTVQNSTFSGNQATGTGGGIYNSSTGKMTVQNSTLADNSAGTAGGIHNGGTLTVQNSTLSGNSATSNGGGIYSEDTLTVQNSTLSGNRAGHGGGIYSSWGALAVRNSTFFGNQATAAGGGIYNMNARVHLSNTLIAHTPFGGDCRNVAGGNIANDHNLMQSTLIAATCGIADGAGGSRIGVDPLLGPLGDYGGTTPTHALLPGSPAIDGGGSTCLATDQRGTPRPQGAACDIGAFEMNSTPAD